MRIGITYNGLPITDHPYLPALLNMSMKKQKKKKDPTAPLTASDRRAQTKRSMVDKLCQDPEDAEAWMNFLNQIEVSLLSNCTCSMGM